MIGYAETCISQLALSYNRSGRGRPSTAFPCLTPLGADCGRSFTPPFFSAFAKLQHSIEGGACFNHDN